MRLRSSPRHHKGGAAAASLHDEHHATAHNDNRTNPNAGDGMMRRTWAGNGAWEKNDPVSSSLPTVDHGDSSNTNNTNNHKNKQQQQQHHGGSFWKQRHRTWHGPGHWFHHHHHHKKDKHDGSTKREVDLLSQDEDLLLSSRQSPQEQQHQRTGQHHHRHHHHHHGLGCSAKAFTGPAHALGKFWHALEEFLFPKSRLLDMNDNTNNNTNNKDKTPKLRPGMVLLEGCETVQDHYDKIKQVCCAIQYLHGKEGLEAAGLEYRWILCDEHKPSTEDMPENDDVGNENDSDDRFHANGSDSDETDSEAALPLSALPSHLLPDGTPNLAATDIFSTIRSTDTMFTNTTCADNDNNNNNITGIAPIPPNTAISHNCGNFCHWCSRRLFYQQHMIDEENRKKFIADGDMYEQVARLCQEYAHERMCQEADLQWVTVEEENDRPESLRVLVSANHSLLQCETGRGENKDEDNNDNNRPTLVICTGRGKVRAGIFSRKHLICSGMEIGTAIPMIREAVVRQLHVMVIDPNVHGEANGFITFQKTMDYYCARMLNGNNVPVDDNHQSSRRSATTTPPPPLYILSHSASGGHFARYLLDAQQQPFLSHVAAVAFTDSTHNIQWAARKEEKEDSEYGQELYQFLESPVCVYFRCAHVRRNGLLSNKDWYMHPAGAPAQTDQYWKHRFGNIKTLWAGTNEHSLTNWYAHTKIWEHFDEYLIDGGGKGTTLAS